MLKLDWKGNFVTSYLETLITFILQEHAIVFSPEMVRTCISFFILTYIFTYMTAIYINNHLGIQIFTMQMFY